MAFSPIVQCLHLGVSPFYFSKNFRTAHVKVLHLKFVLFILPVCLCSSSLLLWEIVLLHVDLLAIERGFLYLSSSLGYTSALVRLVCKFFQERVRHLANAKVRLVHLYGLEYLSVWNSMFSAHASYTSRLFTKGKIKPFFLKIQSEGTCPHQADREGGRERTCLLMVLGQAAIPFLSCQD